MSDDFDFDTVTVQTGEPTMPLTVCQHEDCNKPPVEYSGRGPRPKYCAEHKRRPNKSKSSKSSKKKYATDYTEGISGLLNLPAAVLGIVGSQGEKYEYLADAAVISHHTPTIAAALNDLAQDRPEIAAALDRVLKVGPYGVLFASVMPMALQIMANHRVIPAGMMGTQSPEQVLGLPERKDSERKGSPEDATEERSAESHAAAE